ncbi:hypothetical protein FRC10_007882 [Ceratobasidium sp. 414]|nr:hypothetical protein FRC10_007882 [Ceratobasidium sp. 414]
MWVFREQRQLFAKGEFLLADGVHDMNDTYRAIKAMMILHNMCFDHGDAPEFSRTHLDDEEDAAILDDVDQNLDYADDEVEQGNMDSLQAGWAFRERCMATICP